MPRKSVIRNAKKNSVDIERAAVSATAVCAVGRRSKKSLGGAA